MRATVVETGQFLSTVVQLSSGTNESCRVHLHSRSGIKIPAKYSRVPAAPGGNGKSISQQIKIDYDKWKFDWKGD